MPGVTAMSRDNPEPVTVAVLAKAPIPGFCKARLKPALGPDGAAMLQERLIAHTVATVKAANVGPVVLWATPDEAHPAFHKLAALGVRLMRQPDGDLGARMLAAAAAADGPVLVTGTDCPALTSGHLRYAAEALRDGIDAVVFPVDDGGYALIGSRCPQPTLFADIAWSTAAVMAVTRSRLARLGLSWREPARLWDVDLAADLERLRESPLGHLIPVLANA